MDQFMNYLQSNPEVVSAVIGFAASFVVLLFGKFVKFCFSSAPLSEAAEKLAYLMNFKKAAWRWGMKADRPTGNSVIYDAPGSKIVANLKKDSYTLNDEELYLSSSDKKQLRRLRKAVVANLKKVDAATAANRVAAKRREQMDRLVKL